MPFYGGVPIVWTRSRLSSALPCMGVLADVGGLAGGSMDSPRSRVAGRRAQGPDVGASIRSVKYPFARSCSSLGSPSVPMYSSRKSSRTWTFGVSRAGPEKSAHSVIGSGLHCGRMGIRLLRTSALFAIHKGRMAMPKPLMASFRATVGSLVTTLKRMCGAAVFWPRLNFQTPEPMQL